MSEGIHIKKKNRGKFTATKKRTGKSTEELTHSKNPLTRKRAIFAQNARKWNHKGGKNEGFVRLTRNKLYNLVCEVVEETLNMGGEYMNAVESGDMAKVERMVRKAAKRAMPDTKVADEDGELLAMYHTTPNRFNAFDKNRINTSGHGNYIGFGFNFASHQTTYGTNVMKVYLDAKNPLRSNDLTLSEEQVVDILKKLGYRIRRPNMSQTYSEQLCEFVHNELRYYGGCDTDIYHWICGFSFDANDVMEVFEDLGYDSSIVYGFADDKIKTAVVFRPEQIKSAEPVTYDDNGEVIPLEERFNTSINDIRY